MIPIKVFFSWQSDVSENHEFIRSTISDITKEYKNRGILIEQIESTGRKIGSVDIIETVKDNINKSDIFIADITPVTRFGNKAMPNSNVMYELGIASAKKNCTPCKGR
ncbi:MAG: hypothetical protein K6G31_05870 [Paludibacteraceae bacterium]|nr:hypothetical protein [Paludibacteraceae bacterium]